MNFSRLTSLQIANIHAGTGSNNVILMNFTGNLTALLY